MNLNYNETTGLVILFNKTPMDRKQVLEFGIASAIARRCTALSEDVLEEMSEVSEAKLDTLYNKKFRNKVAVVVNEINGYTVIDTQRVKELVNKLFIYMAGIFAGCFKRNIICTMPAGPGDIFNLGRYVDNELLTAVYENISDYNAALMTMSNLLQTEQEDILEN